MWVAALEDKRRDLGSKRNAEGIPTSNTATGEWALRWSRLQIVRRDIEKSRARYREEGSVRIRTGRKKQIEREGEVGGGGGGGELAGRRMPEGA